MILNIKLMEILLLSQLNNLFLHPKSVELNIMKFTIRSSKVILKMKTKEDDNLKMILNLMNTLNNTDK